jgi:outer membrane protein assembly factor BamB
LWVISGGKTIVTQIDPKTNAASRRVTVPHPVAYGTVAHGSLWLVSYGENALIELDAQTGKLLRTLESSPELRLSEPVGIAVTGRDLWVLNHHNSKLLRLNEQTGTLTGITQLPGDAAAGPFLVGHTLWVGMTAQGLLHQVDPVSGKIVGRPLHVPTGMCAGASIIGHNIWATSVPFGDFECTNGTSRVDTTSGNATPLASAEGKSLYTLTRYAGSLWATDLGKTLYQVDRSGSLNTVMTFDGKDAGRLFSAFGSMWMTRPGERQLLRLRKS